jgi:phosphoglycerate dehydrogenase-like enzyme
MLVLMSLRRAGDWNTRMHRDGYWISGSVAPAGSLFGRRVGLHGFGKVARALVELLRPFHVPIAAFDPYVDPVDVARFGVRRLDSLETLFAESDVVVELAALSPETEGVINESHLTKLPNDGVFVNIGRGAVVDEPALVRVARSGRLHIGLDVYHTEPLPADHPLRGLEKVILLPHIAGPTPDRRNDVGRFALANLKRYVQGLPLEARVTVEDYRRTT